MSTLVAEKLKDFFGGDPGLSRTDQVERLELFKAAMAESHEATNSGQVHLGLGESVRDDGRPSMHIRKGLSPQAAAERFERLEKSASGNAEMMQMIAELRGPIGPDIQKDWTPTNPIASGLVPYDLEAPAKVLVPKYTPLRNTLPRIKGQGNARQYKRITSFTNSGQASASILPFFDSSTQTSTWGGPGNLTLNRPQKISYTGDNQSRAYVELGFSDQVNFKAQFQGLGFENLRALSHTAVLWSSLMGEERAILFGRGATGGGYKGIVAAPGGITTGTAATGGTIADGTYYVYVRSVQGGGLFSAVSTVASQVLAGTNINTLTVTVGTEAAGSLGVYELYVGTTTGIANAKFQTQFIGNTKTITSYNASGAVIAGTDASFLSTAYDGFYAVQSDTSQTGYFLRHNGAISTSNPGVEFETALTTMWTANGASPDEIWMTGAGVQALSDALRSNPSSNGYRTNLVSGDNGVTVGGMVRGIVNTATGEIVDIKGHRYAQPGSALLRSRSLPLTDSEVPAPVAMVNVQDYMALDWPVIQMSYDVSTYWMGTMIHYAPEWSGLIVGITNG
jgi:hypothetical protein